CSPSRAALLTGRHTWQLENAGTHASSFPAKYRVYPDILEDAGYFVGYTGKGWGPGNWKISGRPRNPAGRDFSQRTMKSPKGINSTDYAGNFEEFLKAKPDDRPFCFWFGGKEPHRSYQKGIGREQGKKLEDAHVPPFLPDVPEVRSDILDFCAEIEWFDTHLGRMLKLLEERGELENTLIVVTSDNGMPFPRAKANCYEHGIHVPFAVCWPKRVPAGRTVTDLVGFVDIAPTFLEAAGITVPDAMTGKSFLNVLTSEKDAQVDASRTRAFAARERHSSSRYENWTYPIRAMRTPEYLYIRNFRPERWPAGDPHGFEGDAFGYYDIDGSPTKTLLVERQDDERIAPYFHLAVDKRPAEELYDVKHDPGCLTNLADDPKHASARDRLRRELEEYLRKTGDPRVLDGGEVFESYKRYSPIRTFPAPE
ncbi:MAG: sulfatase family protein, partial [Planctomycetaceae bacterium]